jgi:hypothetical protein
MSTSGIPPLAWGLLCVISGATFWAWHGDFFPPIILVCAGAGSMLLGAALQLRRPHDPYQEPHEVTDSSIATVAVAAGFAMIALGVPGGLWITLIGAGVVVLGAGGLVREWLAVRRVRRRLAERRVERVVERR